jgi:hypothetical protein
MNYYSVDSKVSVSKAMLYVSGTRGTVVEGAGRNEASRTPLAGLCDRDTPVIDIRVKLQA